MVYRFGNFELDVATRELRRDGQRVETEPKAFELLTYLVEHADRAVSKDELQTELWPRSIVTETALTRAVMKARRAVGDDASEQSMIRTVHGHGYRFIGELGDGPATSAAETVEPTRERRPYLRFAVILVILAAAVMTVVQSLGPTATGVRGGTASVAVLPVSSSPADDDSLSWVRLGMMGLMSRMLEDAGIDVSSERAVLTAIGDAPVPRPMSSEFLERVTGIAAATAVLDLTLQEENGLFRMSAVLAATNGETTRRVIVGDTPAAVAADMARVIGAVLDNEATRSDRRLRRVSADPFINEAYARALDLELQGELEEARTLFRVAAEQEPELFWLRYEIALCTRDLREWDDAEKQFDELYQEALAAGDGGAQIATLNSLGVMYLQQEDFDKAGAALEAAIATADDGVSAADRASVFVNLALIASNRDDRAAARQHYESALAEFEAAELSPAPTFYNNFAGLLISEGQLARAQEYSELAVAGFQRRGQRRFEASALNRLGRILRRRGDLDGALQRHEQALAIQRDLDNPLGEVIVIMAMTNVYRDKGDLTRARLNAIEARDQAAELDHLGLKADAEMYLAQVEEDLGNFAVARDGYIAARNIFVTQGTPPGLRYADESIARTTYLVGDTRQARRLAAELVTSAEQSGDARALGRSKRLAAQIDHSAGNSTVAIEQFLEVLDAARQRDDDLMVAGTSVELAGVYLDLEMTAEAAALVESLDATDPDPDIARLRGRLAFAEGNASQAAAIMSDLRLSAGEAWSAADQAMLDRFLAASSR